jgi:hypothetical protein
MATPDKNLWDFLRKGSTWAGTGGPFAERFGAGASLRTPWPVQWSGGSALARLLAERRRMRHHSCLPELTLEQIQAWALAHRQRTGKWPTALSGPVAEAPGETWRAVELALVQGHRGLPKGSSLARVLKPLKEKSP